jgi:hypothetical protein
MGRAAEVQMVCIVLKWFKKAGELETITCQAGLLRQLT